jgi:translation elongation factor P/translation initiation factor 5A
MHKFTTMSFKTDITKRFFTKQDIGGAESINDLRDKEFSGKSLSAEEKFALANFDKYRLQVLNSQDNEDQFHLHYRQIQVISNLGDWHEFLKEEYNK